MPVDQVLMQAIINGRFDASLDHLATLIQQRRQIVAHQFLTTLQTDDRVRYNASTRPRYLRGMTGTVLYTTDKVYVRIDRAVGKYSPDRPVGTPPALLTRISQ